MNSIFDFIVKPLNKRYNNTKEVNGVNLILNTDLADHKYVSKEAVVVSVPKYNVINVKKGDKVMVHHNVFRRFYDIKGIEKNSKSYFMGDMYFCGIDQIYFNVTNKTSIKGFCFVKPIESTDEFSLDSEEPLKGVVKYTDNSELVAKEDLIGFTPESEFEFVINNEKLYRVPLKSIAIKYERKGTEVEYNPSRLRSG